MDNKTYIYSLCHPTTMEIRYIGKSGDLDRRLKTHLRDKAKTHKTNWINSLVLNGLIPHIEIIDEVLLSEWEFWEKHYISLYKSWGINLTNMSSGGDGGDAGIEANEKRKKSLLGHILSDETKIKIGKKNFGARRTPDALNKMSVSQRVAFIDGRKNHLRLFNNGCQNPRAFKVVQKDIDLNIIRIWDYGRLACVELGVSPSAISSCINGHQKTAGGFIWEKYIPFA